MMYQPMTDETAFDAWVTLFAESCEPTAPADEKEAAFVRMAQIRRDYPQAFPDVPLGVMLWL